MMKMWEDDDGTGAGATADGEAVSVDDDGTGARATADGVAVSVDDDGTDAFDMSFKDALQLLVAVHDRELGARAAADGEAVSADDDGTDAPDMSFKDALRLLVAVHDRENEEALGEVFESQASTSTSTSRPGLPAARSPVLSAVQALWRMWKTRGRTHIENVVESIRQDLQRHIVKTNWDMRSLKLELDAMKKRLPQETDVSVAQFRFPAQQFSVMPDYPQSMGMCMVMGNMANPAPCAEPLRGGAGPIQAHQAPMSKTVVDLGGHKLDLEDSIDDRVSAGTKDLIFLKRELQEQLQQQQKELQEQLRQQQKELQEQLLQQWEGSIRSIHQASHMQLADTNRELGSLKEKCCVFMTQAARNIQVLDEKVCAKAKELGRLKEKSDTFIPQTVSVLQVLDDKVSAKAKDLDRLKSDFEAQLAKTKDARSKPWSALRGSKDSEEQIPKSNTDAAQSLKQEIALALKQVGYLRQDLDRLHRKPVYLDWFKRYYPPTYQEVHTAVRFIIDQSMRKMGVDSDCVIHDFRSRILYDPRDKPGGKDDVAFYGGWLWTNEQMLSDLGVPVYCAFCDILAEAAQHSATAAEAALVQKAIISTWIEWPQDAAWRAECKTWRGAYIDTKALTFWTDLLKEDEDRQRYRTAIPLTTWLKQNAAVGSISGSAPPNQQKVLFEFKWENAVNPCTSARYIDPVSAFGGKEQILLTSYSVLKVEMLKRGAVTDVWQYKIYVSVERDMQEWPDHLPITRWH